jgi:uncharacterized membrane protein
MIVVKALLRVSLLFVVACPFLAYAEEGTMSDTMTILKAQVLQVTDAKDTVVLGTDTTTKVQTIQAKVLEAPDTGKIVTFSNDYTQLVVGEIFYLRHISSPLDGAEYYSVADPYRLNILIGLTIVFLILLFIFGGIQGIRGLASLCGSFVLIFYLLLPGILQGYSPILVSIGVSSLIIVLGSYITHGFNKTTSAAVLGMIVTVTLTGLAALYVVHAANLSGYSSEENVYLNFGTRGSIDMVALLFGGIMIGLLGVLYDMAIGQAVAVEELFKAGTHLTRVEVYRRAIRIGREHVGALVNTLAIAYVGVALPLLLLIQNSSTMGIGFTLNNEMFATEIVRILIGSIGLILCVPITTLIATYLLQGQVGGVTNSHSHSHRH